MEIEKLLMPEYIEICNSLKNKNAVLKKIAELAKQNPILNKIDEKDLFAALQEREEVGSTAISSRIAIPHCRLAEIDDFVLGLLIVKDGVDFKAIDKKKTFIFSFIIAPAKRQNEHVRLLSYISQYLRKQENIDKLLSSNEKENVRNSIIRHTKMPNEIEPSDSHKLVTVIVQKEDKFSDILNCITEIEDSNISILESSNAGHYLYHMPLFTSFMQTDRNDFCRIIIVSINRNRLKEMIGNLEDIIQGEDGVMYFVQNIEYFSGKLEI